MRIMRCIGGMADPFDASRRNKEGKHIDSPLHGVLEEIFEVEVGVPGVGGVFSLCRL